MILNDFVISPSIDHGAFHLILPFIVHFVFVQVAFSIVSGNIGRAFEIRTTNGTYGEVFVARPLDRELIEHYTLKVIKKYLPSDLHIP